jgi:hypothetical protein
MDDKWPERPTLRSPFNNNVKCAGVGIESHLKPDASPVVIQQIANAMGGSSSNSPRDQGEQCSQMLATMPEFPEMDPPRPAEPLYMAQPHGLLGQEDVQNVQNSSNDELTKLFKSGYRPIDKIDGQWTETSEGNGKLIVE